jgi:hypothetical protein
VIFFPLGWMMVTPVSATCSGVPGAVSLSSDSKAPVSMRAVWSRLEGLAQPAL